ncbi:unnamed protein product [Ostreobium quekettii]|uniref:G-patch domain-containing protein n=1 Tax=Ostreobium quekettii TaxID=121088 RepID=A0A8S1JC33_9CHLO|nr:unnamed protein product [Ostreobium quekettii]
MRRSKGVILRRERKLWTPSEADRAAVCGEPKQTPGASTTEQHTEQGIQDKVATLKHEYKCRQGGTHKEQLSNAHDQYGEDDELAALMRQYECQAKADLEAAQAQVAAPKSMSGLREKGLTERIAPSNKGYQLLAQMGYQHGQGLGTEGKGAVDPIDVIVRQGRQGLGAEDPRKRKQRMREKHRVGEESKRLKLAQGYRDFASRSFQDQKAEGQLRSAQNAVEQLDRENCVEPHTFWPAIGKDPADEEEGFSKELQMDSDVAQTEWNSLPAGERLQDVVQYLRETYCYCFWCGCKYESSEEMQAACPGLSEADH